MNKENINILLILAILDQTRLSRIPLRAVEKPAKPRHFFATWRRKCVYGGKVHRRKRKGNLLFTGERCRRLYSLHSVRDP